MQVARSQSMQAQVQMSAEEVDRRIQESAYLKACARGFAPGGELQDWLEAEAEVRSRISPRSVV